MDYASLDHQFYMAEALSEADKAYLMGEIPIGAVIVKNNEIIARAHNLRETEHDATAHAEMIAIKEASKALGGWRLQDTVMYATIEPCAMCAGALVQSRVRLLVYGAKDPKAGAVHSIINLVQNKSFNHQLDVISGVLEEECGEIMKRFFKELRKKNF